MKRSMFVTAVITAALVLPAQAALALPSQDVIGGTDAFDCEFGGPPGHCLNVKSKGNTGLILVFEEGHFTAEGVSFDEKAASRPCPHDDDATEGTWWLAPNGAYVCHHRS